MLLEGLFCHVNHAYRGKPNTPSLIIPYLPRENVAAMGDFFPFFLKGKWEEEEPVLLQDAI